MLVRVLRFGDVEQIWEIEIHYFHLRISCRNVNGFPNVSNVTENLVKFQFLEMFTTLLKYTTIQFAYKCQTSKFVFDINQYYLPSLVCSFRQRNNKLSRWVGPVVERK